MEGIGSCNSKQERSARRRCCICSKDDFLPEESFRSWGNYVNALREMKTRLKNRLLTRSSDELELHDMKARSQNEMKKTLNWFDLFWFGIGSILGAGVFVLTGQAARNFAGPAILLSYILAGISAVLSVLCYTEFSVDLPVAGGSFAYIRVELGDLIAYIAAGNILFEYIVGGASVACSWTSYFATLCNQKPDDFRIHVSFLAEGYNDLDPIAVFISMIICLIAALSIKGSARFTSVTTSTQILVIIFILVAGLTKANPANYSNFAPFGVRGIVKASAILFFAFVGFDGVATLGEEIQYPGKDIPIGLIGSMSLIIILYCLLAATICLMQPYSEIDANAPFSIAFQAVGMNWAKFLVAFGALKGMTTVLLSNILGQARYFTHISRTHLAPPFLAVISGKTGTPINATLIMTVGNCIVAFFTDMEILSNLLSISTLFIFTLVALSLLVRRYYAAEESSSSDWKKLILFLTLIILSSIASSITWAMSKSGWICYAVLLGLWFLATLGLQLMVKQARKPKVWGVPMVPWVPSTSIAINIFIMGSIDGSSFIRFAIWTLFLLVYYLFIGLHASYDAAKEHDNSANGPQTSKSEADVAGDIEIEAQCEAVDTSKT